MEPPIPDLEPSGEGSWEGRRAANRRNWDDRTPVHLRSRFYDIEGWLRRRPGPRRYELEALGDVSGLRLLHLQCHVGLDTLAWATAGARVTGLDFSPAAIAAAEDLARRAELSERARFICSDVYEATRALGGATFDVVYVSLGALCWLPDVDRWAEQVGRLVAPGGRFYLHDGHPVSIALSDDRVTFEFSYFEESEPFVTDDSATYTGGGAIEHQRTYQWNHSLGETVSALVRHGLRLDWLAEHDWTLWRRFDWLEETADGRYVTPAGRPRVPLSFSLLARRATDR